MALTFHNTIPRQFLEAVEAHHKPDAFRVKREGHYEDVSHADVLTRVHALACALKSLRLARADRVALLSENRIEWAIADLAILSCGCVNVPIYSTLPANQIEYLLRDSEARAVFVSSKAQLAKIAGIRDRLPHLELVIAFDTEATGDGVRSLDSLLSDGRALTAASDYKKLIAEIGPSDWASIIYTSGTTGEPKGAVLTHGNFIANIRQCLAVFELGPADTCLSFLPLSHVFERSPGFYVMMTAGVTIAYAESIETVPANLIETRPTVVCSVPRVYEKMYARILDTAERSGRVKYALFQWAVRSGRAWATGHLAGKASPLLRLRLRVATALVLKKVQARVGGRLRFFVSGGAPLAREIAEFFYAAGIPVLEGYGLTETSPVLSVNVFGAFKFGTVGKPLPGVEIRIAEDGEILARGDNVMHGYFRKPTETAEAITDGWFHTGDIGHLDEEGYLVITDRKKDLIATAGGKKVAPQPIECRLKQDPMIAEAVLIGNRRPFIGLLIVPNFERLDAWARTNGLATTERAALLAEPTVRELFQKLVDGANANLANFERIKSFDLLEHELTIQDGDLTPTLKVRRRNVEEHFSARIDAMYGVHAAAR